MDIIHTNLTIPLEEMVADPKKAMRASSHQPFCVLENGRPLFYAMSPKAYDDLLERMWELKIIPEIMAAKDEPTYEVSLEDLRKGIFPEGLDD